MRYRSLDTGNYMARRKINKNCPLTEDEILTFKAMLYQVNTSHRCVNPAPFSWVHGYQWWQTEKINMEMKQRIKIEGKNINDLFALPCVRTITKTGDGSIKLKVKLAACHYEYATIGDWLIEDNGQWHIEKGEQL